MKRCGFFENTDFLDITVGMSYLEDLAKAIRIAYDIEAETLCDCIRVRKTPIVESGDIRSIKRFVHRWIDDKMKGDLGTKISRCKHCGDPIAYYAGCGWWYHETSTNHTKTCNDNKNLAEP